MAEEKLAGDGLSRLEVVESVRLHLEEIRNLKMQTKPMQDLMSRGLMHLEKEEWRDVTAVLELHLSDCLVRLSNFAPRDRKNRDRLQTAIAKDRRCIKLLVMEKYRPVLEGLEVLHNHAQMQTERDSIQSVIVKLKEGRPEYAQTWLAERRLQHRQLGRLSQHGRQRVIHRSLSEFAQRLLRLLRDAG